MSGFELDERTVLTHWAPKPVPARLGGRWRRKVAYQQETRERAAALKRRRYATNQERERAKARARYRADPKCLARKLRCNMTPAQRRAAKAADRRKYERHREKMIADQVARDRGKRFFRQLLDLLDPPVRWRVAVEATCPRAQLSAPSAGLLRATPSYHHQRPVSPLDR